MAKLQRLRIQGEDLVRVDLDAQYSLSTHDSKEKAVRPEHRGCVVKSELDLVLRNGFAIVSGTTHWSRCAGTPEDGVIVGSDHAVGSDTCCCHRLQDTHTAVENVHLALE